MSRAEENWVHLFFTRDIDIIGFGLNFNETHLWFLLNFRARLIRHHAGIRNTIRWIIADFSSADQKDKIEVLEALHVKVIQVPVPPAIAANKDKKYEYLYNEFTSNHKLYR
jgi:hypothetical protein